ncbi:MAG TPA: NlpC/P60 family protein [Gaiellaceae bacterium]|nr:NlpC/P60 family protein [Gaiellaceae bacterium]
MRRSALPIAAGVALCVCAGTARATGTPAIKAETARAQRVLAQVQQINVELGRAAEAWDGARYRLGVLKAHERATRARLTLARASERVALRRLERLLVTLYESPQNPILSVISGASNLDQVITRLNGAQRLSDEQASLTGQLQRARATLERESRVLDREVAAAKANETRLAAQRTAIAAKLQRRQQLLGSIRTEISALKAAERARERELAREARARLLKQIAAQKLASERARQARLQQQAEERLAQARARQHAAAQRTTAPPPPTTTTDPPPAPAPPSTTASSPPPAPAPAPAPAPPPAPVPSGGNTQVVSIAMQYLGIPYHWGGASPQTGFDCSGLVMYVFAQVGISLPHFAAAQYHYGTAVARDQLEPGDLVFFDNLNHVGIYVGNGEFIHAPHTGDVVRITSMSGWYDEHYVGARRVG